MTELRVVSSGPRREPASAMPEETSALVLIVEDELYIGLRLARLLEAHGYEVLGPVATASAALALCEDGLPDAALLDVRLGDDATSCDVAAFLAEWGVPYGLVTANERARFFGFETTPRFVVEKPFDDARVLAGLRSILA